MTLTRDPHPLPSRLLSRYLKAAVLVSLANAVAYLATGLLTDSALAMVFLLAVLAAGAWLGLGASLAAALLSGLTYNFLHIEPRFTLTISHPDEALTFAVFFAAALITGWLSGRVRDRALITERQSRQLSVLLDASQALAAAPDAPAAARVLAGQIITATGTAAVVLLPEVQGLRLAGGPAGLDQLAGPSQQAAERVWRSGGVEESADWAFERVDGAHGPVAVAGLREPRITLEPGRRALLDALLRQGAAALERTALARAAGENQALRAADQLRSALLGSISHDFRTPLSTVLGSATTLLDYEAQLTPEVRRDLLFSIREGAERLNRHIGALLDMARLDGGALSPRSDPLDVTEIVGSALRRVESRLSGRTVRHALDPTLPAARGDAILLEQAVLNLLDNALSHTPAEAVMTVQTLVSDGGIMIAVEDDGPGVALSDQAEIFDKFYRLQTHADRSGGLGLGLSIVKGFMEAMGGHAGLISPVAAGAGSRFTLWLPLAGGDRAMPR